MKSPEVQNVVVDEANEVTYEVTAHRRLTDGEVYSAIRVALLHLVVNDNYFFLQRQLKLSTGAG